MGNLISLICVCVSCGCNNIISSSTTNIRELESFFCQFWPAVCENSLICDINNNPLASHHQGQKDEQEEHEVEEHEDEEEHEEEEEQEEQNTNSISSSSVMLIIPESRTVTPLTPLKSPGLVLSLIRRSATNPTFMILNHGVCLGRT